MIQVTVDSDMRKAFRRKAILGVFREGDDIFRDERPCWMNLETGLMVFISGPKGTYQYDDEFTEWLEAHRPEVFL